ncbi:uncharacterized protein V6R79_025524 [Siganus canaliculatus]
MMPRSFLVKRGGLHHIRHTARSSSPGSNSLSYDGVGKHTGSWDGSVEYSTEARPDTNAVPIAVLQQDLQAVDQSNKRGTLKPFSPKSDNSRSAESCIPVNSETLSLVEKAEHCPPATVLLSRPYVNTEYSDKPSEQLGDLTQHPHFLKRTRSSSKSGAKQECPLCGQIFTCPSSLKTHLCISHGSRALSPAHIRSSRTMRTSDSSLSRGQDIRLLGVRQSLQTLLHPLHSSAHTLRHPPVSLPVLWQEVPPEVGHEETHLHTHRGKASCLSNMWEGVQPELQPHHSQPKAQRRPALPLSSLLLQLPAES